MHHLRLYPRGKRVSGLQMTCILYVDIQLLLPGQDAGIDLAMECELAKDQKRALISVLKESSAPAFCILKLGHQTCVASGTS